MSGNKFLNKINKFLDKITEPVPEIKDNGLNEDYVEPTTTVSASEPIKVQESAPSKEPKKLFGKQKTEVSVAPVAESVETNTNLHQLLKTTPDTVAESSIEETVKSTETVKMDTFPVYNKTTDEKEMSREELFAYYMDVRDELIVDFADTCYDTIEGIQSNQVISQERKREKIANIENEFLSISNDDHESIFIFFKKVKHELHMLQNNLGEYDERVYKNGLISDPRIKNYNIEALHRSDDLFEYLSTEDKEAINTLLDMCEEIHKRANLCKCLDAYIPKTERLIMSCNTILDIVNAEEQFNDMLMDLNVKINTSSDNNSLLA